MDFGLTNSQQKLKYSVRTFCEKEFDPDYAIEMDRKQLFPIELYRKVAKRGFSNLFIPEQYGGMGKGYLASCLAMEEMCRADSSLGLACMIGNFGSDMFLLYGTEEQKNSYLPPLCCGDNISAVAFTEPDCGTDISNVNTTAVKKGKELVINGTKTFITNAPLANFFIVFCKTRNNNVYRKNHSLFVVDKDSDGLSVTKLQNKMGIRCVTMGEVSFKDVKVSENNIIGEKGNGYSHSMEFFTISRLAVAAQAIGTAQGAFEIALKYAKKRESDGQPIIRFQQIGTRLATVVTEIEAAKLLTYKAAWTIDQNNVDPMLTSMAKLYSSGVAVRATDAAIQTLGGYGYLADYKVERAYRDAKITEIYEGTSEIQRLAILKHLIKTI